MVTSMTSNRLAKWSLSKSSTAIFWQTSLELGRPLGPVGNHFDAGHYFRRLGRKAPGRSALTKAAGTIPDEAYM